MGVNEINMNTCGLSTIQASPQLLKEIRGHFNCVLRCKNTIQKISFKLHWFQSVNYFCFVDEGGNSTQSVQQMLDNRVIMSKSTWNFIPGDNEIHRGKACPFSQLIAAEWRIYMSGVFDFSTWPVGMKPSRGPKPAGGLVYSALARFEN